MRIIDLPEATELAEDDYLVMASEGGGACKIKAKLFEPVLLRINAVYTQTETVYDNTPLDDLKTDLVVTAYYQGGGSRVIDDYTLSGTLEVGSSVITVSYKGKTDTITVEVSSSVTYLYKWDFTKSLTDEIQGVTASLTNATLTQGVGVVTDAYKGIVELVSITQNIIDKTIELDFTDLELTPTPQSVYVSAMLLGRGGNFKFAYGFTSGVEKWLTYDINNTALSYNSTSNQIIFNNGGNFKFVFTSENLKVYLNGELFFDGEPFTGGTNVTMLIVGTHHRLIDGFKFTLTGARIYNNQ